MYLRNMTNNRLENTIKAIDNINSQDINTITTEEGIFPKEVLYSLRMTACLQAHWPKASELLSIAIRAQHIERWAIPRTDYPLGKAGYYKWRTELAKHHAKLTSQVMRNNEYDASEINDVCAMLEKKNLKSCANTQTLEDVACLVFLTYYFDDFYQKHDEEKLISIVRKTWNKMSEKGHTIALEAKLPTHLQSIVNKALA